MCPSEPEFDRRAVARFAVGDTSARYRCQGGLARSARGRRAVREGGSRGIARVPFDPTALAASPGRPGRRGDARDMVAGRFQPHV